METEGKNRKQVGLKKGMKEWERSQKENAVLSFKNEIADLCGAMKSLSKEGQQ